MIIVLARDDPGLLASARQQSYNFPAIYGETYVAGDENIPQLGPEENLFFSGHGADEGESGQPEIGDKNPKSGFYVDGTEMWESFKEIFPPEYAGDVYVSACESADFADDLLSLIETFKTQSSLALENTSVFGQAGEVGFDIPPPADGGWIEAGEVG